MNSLVGWILLTLVCNPGLTAKVEAHRAGRVVTLDYQLLEADGRRHVDRQQREKPPEFTVSQNGRQVGSGTLAYG